MRNNKLKKSYSPAIPDKTLPDYLVKIKEYANPMPDNTLLESLAEKGYQVGTLAKSLYPESFEIAPWS